MSETARYGILKIYIIQKVQVLENGITEVELDVKEEHYWMDVYKKTNKE